MLEPLLNDYRAGTRLGLLRAARRAFTLAFGVLALPGLPLGVLYAVLGRPAPLLAVQLALLLGLAALLGGVVLLLSHRAATEAGQLPQRAALTAAIQAATAPAIPFLIGCAFFAQPLVLFAFWFLAAGLFAAARRQLPGWVREPSSS